MSAEKLIRDVMSVKPDETVAIYADSASDQAVVDATASAVLCAGAVPVVATVPTLLKKKGDYPKQLCELLRNSDVVIEMGGRSIILYTPTYEAIRETGKARYTCLVGINRDTFLNAFGKVDIKKTIALSEEVARLTELAKVIRITSAAGTDVVAKMDGRKTQVAGIAKDANEAVMMIGQVGWCPQEESINGTIVIDGAFGPPKVTIPKTPISLTVKRGSITEINGQTEAQTLKNLLSSWKNENVYKVAHYTYGLNPGVLEYTGTSMLVDERLFGGHTFGFGYQGDIIGGKGVKAPSHFDAVCTYPNVWLDGTQIEKDGRWVHPALVKICKEMRLQGY